MTISEKWSCNRPATVLPPGAVPDGIERLLCWTYQAQYAHLIQVDDDLRLQRRASFMRNNSWADFDRLAQLGTMVDGSGGGFDIHPDAEDVHGEVLRLDEVARGLVIMHANGGNRPDWMPNARLRALPILRGNGKPLVEYDGGKRPNLCPIRYDPPAGHVEFMRSMWIVWWDAVQAVADSLSERWGRPVAGAGEAREPWAKSTPVDSAEKV